MASMITTQKFSSLVLALMLIGCGAATGDAPPEDDTASSESRTIANKAVKVRTSLRCSKGTKLDYENFGRGFLLNYCTSCHSSDLDQSDRAGSPVEINLDSHQDAQLWRARMLKVVKESPTSGPVAQEEEKDGEKEEIENKEAAAQDGQGESTPSPLAIMPPDDSINDIDRSQFREWLNCGAPAGPSQP